MIESPLPEGLPVILFDEKRTASRATGQCDCDCDCACSEDFSSPPLPQRAFHPGEAAQLRLAPFAQVKLDHDYTLCYGPTCRPSLLNQAALAFLLAFQPSGEQGKRHERFFQTWGDERAFQCVERLLQAGLLTLPQHPPVEHDPQSSVLTAWLHITDRCNLRCTYCYLPHQQQDMSLPTGMAATRAIFRSARQHGYPGVKLKFAGGEPLLCFENVLAIQALAQELAAQYSLHLDSVILSNGTLLTPEKAARLRQAGMRLMISLDGLGHSHDQQRCYPNGMGTFQQVEKGIQAAQKAGITPDISVTITAANAPHLAQLVKWLLEHSLPFSFNFQRESFQFASDHSTIIQGMLEAFDVMEDQLPAHSVLSGLLDRANLSSAHRHTCAAGRHYLVFDQNGRLLPCQMDAEHPLGTVEAPDPLEVCRSRAAAFYTLPVEGRQPCNTCEWSHWCSGGCPLLTDRATGGEVSPSPYCKVYQALFPAVLRLEGKRLLKQCASDQRLH